MSPLTTDPPQRSSLDCFVRFEYVLGVKYHVHSGIAADYGQGFIKADQCTLDNCSESPNYQYEGSR